MYLFSLLKVYNIELVLICLCVNCKERIMSMLYTNYDIDYKNILLLPDHDQFKTYYV